MSDYTDVKQPKLPKRFQGMSKGLVELINEIQKYHGVAQMIPDETGNINTIRLNKAGNYLEAYADGVWKRIQ